MRSARLKSSLGLHHCIIRESFLETPALSLPNTYELMGSSELDGGGKN